MEQLPSELWVLILTFLRKDDLKFWWHLRFVNHEWYYKISRSFLTLRVTSASKIKLLLGNPKWTDFCSSIERLYFDGDTSSDPNLNGPNDLSQCIKCLSMNEFRPFSSLQNLKHLKTLVLKNCSELIGFDDILLMTKQLNLIESFSVHNTSTFKWVIVPEILTSWKFLRCLKLSGVKYGEMNNLDSPKVRHQSLIGPSQTISEANQDGNQDDTRSSNDQTTLFSNLETVHFTSSAIRWYPTFFPRWINLTEISLKSLFTMYVRSSSSSTAIAEAGLLFRLGELPNLRRLNLDTHHFPSHYEANFELLFVEQARDTELSSNSRITLFPNLVYLSWQRSLSPISLKFILSLPRLQTFLGNGSRLIFPPLPPTFSASSYTPPPRHNSITEWSVSGQPQFSWAVLQLVPSLTSLSIDSQIIGPPDLTDPSLVASLIVELNSLTSLSLTASDATPTWIRSIFAPQSPLTSHLKSLCLDYQQHLESTTLSAISQIKHLEYLSIRGCPSISGQDLQYLACPHLKVLLLDDCKNIGPVGLKFISNMVDLEELSLAGIVSIWNTHLRMLFPLKKLRRLNLSRVRRHAGFRSLKGLWPNLVTIDLRSCGIQDDSLKDVFHGVNIKC